MKLPKGLKVNQANIDDYMKDVNRIDTDRRKLELWNRVIRALSNEHYTSGFSQNHDQLSYCETCDIITKALKLDKHNG